MNTPWSNTKQVAHYDVPKEMLKSRGGDPTYVLFRLLAQHHLSKAHNILDVGCAAGFFYGLLREYGWRKPYTGVDITPEFVEKARERYPEAHFEVADATELPFDDGEFDFVLSQGTMFVLDDPILGLKENLRVSRSVAVMDFILNARGKDNEIITSPNRGSITLLGESGLADILQHLDEFRVQMDYLNLGLWAEDRHAAYKDLSYIRHLLIIVRKD